MSHRRLGTLLQFPLLPTRLRTVAVEWPGQRAWQTDSTDASIAISCLDGTRLQTGSIDLSMLEFYETCSLRLISALRLRTETNKDGYSPLFPYCHLPAHLPHARTPHDVQIAPVRRSPLSRHSCLLRRRTGSPTSTPSVATELLWCVRVNSYCVYALTSLYSQTKRCGTVSCTRIDGRTRATYWRVDQMRQPPLSI